MEPGPDTRPMTQGELIDEYFIENRTKLLDIAAFLDRLNRAPGGGEDFRARAFATALQALSLIDHAEEHTIEMILDAGYWTGLTLYPQTKVSPQRAADMVEMYGPERICVASACDWGPSIPAAVPQFVMEMRRRRHPESLIRRIVYDNPVEFLSQSPKCQVPTQRDRISALVPGVK